VESSDPYGKEPSRGQHVHSDRCAEIAHERRSPAVSSPEASPLPPSLMTTEELAVLLHTSKGAVYARHARGGIPGGVRLGRTLRFDPRIIAQWLSANSASAGGRS